MGEGDQVMKIGCQIKLWEKRKWKAVEVGEVFLGEEGQMVQTNRSGVRASSMRTGQRSVNPKVSTDGKARLQARRSTFSL